MHITNAGMTLLPWARKMVRQSIQVQEMMQSMQNSVVGQLRIYCTTTAGKYLLPHRAARYRQHYPGVQIFIQPCVGVTLRPGVGMCRRCVDRRIESRTADLHYPPQTIASQPGAGRVLGVHSFP